MVSGNQSQSVRVCHTRCHDTRSHTTFTTLLLKCLYSVTDASEIDATRLFHTDSESLGWDTHATTLPANRSLNRDGILRMSVMCGEVTLWTAQTVMRIGHIQQGMAKSKRERDRKADENTKRQPERNREKVRDYAREDQAMPGDSGGRLGDLDDALEAQEYPTTTNKLVETCGDHAVETQNGVKSLREVLASTDDQTFVSVDDVRGRILGLIHR